MAKSSKYRGVSWNKDLSKYRAMITMPNNVRLTIGFYLFERDAAIAYDKVAASIGKPTNILKKKTT